MRAFGGLIYFSGAILMIYNLVKTIAQGKIVHNEKAEAVPVMLNEEKKKTETSHSFLERKPIKLLLLSLVVVLVGGMVEIIPTFLIKSNVPTIESVKPYTPLELIGRDIYLREGCYNCHSQMVRPFRSETERYGEYSKAGEFVYDHPFQWGSKRTGPDLARSGVKTGKMYKPDVWHYNHMLDPQKLNDRSIMPKYPWLIESSMDLDFLEKKINAMTTIGVPYPEDYAANAHTDLEEQAEAISEGLKLSGVDCPSDKEIIALIAYIQRLGVDISTFDTEESNVQETK